MEESSRSMGILMQVLRDLTGGSSSELPNLARAAAEAVAALEEAGHPDAHEAARSLIQIAHRAARPDVRREAVAAVCTGLGKSESASADLASWLPAIVDEPEREAATSALVKAGRWEAAEALAVGLATAASLLEQVANARAIADIAQTTVLERTLVENVEANVKGLAVSVAELARSDERGDGLDQLLKVVTEPLPAAADTRAGRFRRMHSAASTGYGRDDSAGARPYDRGVPGHG